MTPDFEMSTKEKYTTTPDAKSRTEDCMCRWTQVEKPEGIFEARLPNSTKQIEERNASGPFALDLFSVTLSFCFVFQNFFFWSGVATQVASCPMAGVSGIRHRRSRVGGGMSWLGLVVYNTTPQSRRSDVCTGHHNAIQSFSMSGCDAGS